MEKGRGIVMTLEKAAIGVVTVGGGVYDIGFLNASLESDETQFSAYGIKDLKEAWFDFCKENGFKTNSITYVFKP